MFCDEGAFTVAQTRRVFEAAQGARLPAQDPRRGARPHRRRAARGRVRLRVGRPPDLRDGDDLAALRAAGVVAVALPGTSYTLHTDYAPARAFLEAGVTLALATDFNPGTCYCENMQMVISLACQEDRLTPDEALYAATMGGAAALGLQDEVGSLEPGKSCDFIVLDAESRHELPYHFGREPGRGASRPCVGSGKALMTLVECVPNFSEGRRTWVVDEVVAAIAAVEGVGLLDRQSDAAHNRSVLTFVGQRRGGGGRPPSAASRRPSASST